MFLYSSWYHRYIRISVAKLFNSKLHPKHAYVYAYPLHNCYTKGCLPVRVNNPRDSISRLFCPPNLKGGGQIVFGANPVGVRVASFPCIIF